jgi:FkbM family methyltransferase
MRAFNKSSGPQFPLAQVSLCRERVAQSLYLRETMSSISILANARQRSTIHSQLRYFVQRSMDSFACSSPRYTATGSIWCRGEASTMNILEGPLLYYSLFGVRGVFLGAQARLLRTPIEVKVAAPGLMHPVRLRLRTTDVPLCREILIDAQYDCELSMPPRVIIDAGANVGLATVFYANRYPNSRIVAIEPELSNYEMLRKNIAHYPNVTPIHAALWKEERELDIFDHGASTTFRTRETGESASRQNRRSTRGVTLDKLMADLGIDYIDLLKVDVEGSEREIFAHSRHWIGKVGVIAVEIHDWIQSGCSESVHLATKDFGLTWQKGDTTYFARNSGGSDGGALARAPQIAHHPIALRFPLRILETA